MVSVNKYLFERSFDPEDLAREREEARRRAAEAKARAKADIQAKAEPPPPPPPTFTEAELAAARAQARAEGRAEGERAGRAAATAAAKASIDNQLAQALDQACRQMAGLVEQQHRSDAALTEQTVQIALTLARKLLPDLARRHGLAEIEAVIGDCLRTMLNEPRIVIRVAEGMIDDLRARLDPLARSLGFEGAVVLLAEPGLGPADCRIQWADGGAERLSDRLWQDIDRAVARALERPDGAAPDAPSAAPDSAALDSPTPDAPGPDAPGPDSPGEAPAGPAEAGAAPGGQTAIAPNARRPQ